MNHSRGVLDDGETDHKRDSLFNRDVCQLPIRTLEAGCWIFKVSYKQGDNSV